MKFTANHITAALALAFVATGSSNAIADGKQHTRHHHLPPHMKVIDKGVKETQQVQSITVDRSIQPTVLKFAE